jgi:hypothetical protein
MIFSKTWPLVLSGKKTQTRRVKRPLDKPYCKYEVGKTYAVQPGRGRPALYKNYDDGLWRHLTWEEQREARKLPNWRYLLELLDWQEKRIRITDIRRETDVRQISNEDVRAEGFASRDEFLATWYKLNGKQYDAWVIEFELVEDE